MILSLPELQSLGASTSGPKGPAGQSESASDTDSDRGNKRRKHSKSKRSKDSKKEKKEKKRVKRSPSKDNLVSKVTTLSGCRSPPRSPLQIFADNFAWCISASDYVYALPQALTGQYGKYGVIRESDMNR